MASWLGTGTGSLFQSIQDAIPDNVTKVIKELSLNADDMVAEREQLTREEAEKKAKQEWSKGIILPWETNDEERCILCDECKDAILKLSEDDSAFLAPFKDINEGRSGVTVAADEEESSTAAEAEAEAEDDHNEKQSPLESSQPVTALLPANFDLESYVGLIERLLVIDVNLKKRHADLIGEDAVSDLTFWKNYFHHCSLARMEIGLDVDELWRSKPALNAADSGKLLTSADAQSISGSVANDNDASSVVSEEITFATQSPGGVVVDQSNNAAAVVGSSPAPNSYGSAAQGETGPASNASGGSSEYDKVSDSDLDDLAAEIAKELEDE